MEYLVLVFAVIAAWLFFFPRRALRRASPWLFLAKPALLGGAVLGGWLAFSSLTGSSQPSAEAEVPHERRTDQTMEYARGDDQLRAMLQQ